MEQRTRFEFRCRAHRFPCSLASGLRRRSCLDALGRTTPWILIRVWSGNRRYSGVAGGGRDSSKIPREAYHFVRSSLRSHPLGSRRPRPIQDGGPQRVVCWAPECPKGRDHQLSRASGCFPIRVDTHSQLRPVLERRPDLKQRAHASESHWYSFLVHFAPPRP